MITQEFNINIIPHGLPPKVPINQYDTGLRTLIAHVYQDNTEIPMTSAYTYTVCGTKPSGTGFSYSATVENGAIVFDVTAQMSVVAGPVRCGILIQNGDDVVGTLAFILDVQQAALTTGTIIDSSDFGTIITDAVVDWMDEHGVPIDSTLTNPDAAANAKATGDALKKRLALNYGAAETITNGTDYDTLQTPGNYKVTTASAAQSMTNCPVGSGHRLFVMSSTQNGRYIQIVMTSSASVYIYQRYYGGTSWSEWKRLALASEIPAVDSTLSISGAAADAKVVGDDLASLETAVNAALPVDIELQTAGRAADASFTGFRDKIGERSAINLFTNDLTPDGRFALLAGGFNPTNGNALGSAYDNNHCKTKAIATIMTGPRLLTMGGVDDYEWTVFWYANTSSTSSGTHSETNYSSINTRSPIVVVPESGDACIRVGFKRVDGANMTTDLDDPTSDYSIIRANFKILSIPAADTGIESTQYGNVGMFNKIGVCGYSFDAGYFYTTAGRNYTRRNHSWIATLAKMYGLEYGCYAVPSGVTVAPDSPYISSSKVCWQSNQYGLPALLADSACDLYWIRMVGNDFSKLGTSYIGTIADIHDGDYTANPDTFYGNYGRIIEQIRAHAPNALFILSYTEYDTSSADLVAFDNALKEIANHYGFPLINWGDDEWYASWVSAHLVSSHPVIADYASMAKAAERLFGQCVKDNWDYFCNFVPAAT